MGRSERNTGAEGPAGGGSVYPLAVMPEFSCRIFCIPSLKTQTVIVCPWCSGYHEIMEKESLSNNPKYRRRLKALRDIDQVERSGSVWSIRTKSGKRFLIDADALRGKLEELRDDAGARAEESARAGDFEAYKRHKALRDEAQSKINLLQ